MFLYSQLCALPLHIILTVVVCLLFSLSNVHITYYIIHKMETDMRKIATHMEETNQLHAGE